MNTEQTSENIFTYLLLLLNVHSHIAIKQIRQQNEMNSWSVFHYNNKKSDDWYVGQVVS